MTRHIVVITTDPDRIHAEPCDCPIGYDHDDTQEDG